MNTLAKTLASSIMSAAIQRAKKTYHQSVLVYQMPSVVKAPSTLRVAQPKLARMIWWGSRTRARGTYQRGDMEHMEGEEWR